MYGSAIRPALLPASVCWRWGSFPSSAGAPDWPTSTPTQVVRNKRPFGPPAAVKGFIAKRSFGPWLPSSPAASGPVRRISSTDHLTFKHTKSNQFVSLLDSFLSLLFESNIQCFFTYFHWTLSEGLLFYFTSSHQSCRSPLIQGLQVTSVLYQ